MTQVSANIFVDQPEMADKAKQLFNESRENVATFYGPARSKPVIVMCTTISCQNKFGLRPLGLAVGRRTVLLAPNGMNTTILTHELLHIELRENYGIQDMFNPRFPSWFDEGLASYLSLDERYQQPVEARDADWVKKARNFRVWNRLHRVHHWSETYGAAARLVREIDEKIGRDGLKSFINKVRNGADFEETLTEAMR